MLRTVVLAVLLLTHPKMDFAGSDAAITIAPARTRIVTNRADLARACATNDRIFGCTAFAGEKLTSTCERHADKWQIQPAVQFIPYIYVLANGDIGHEKLHIDDVHRSVQQYLTDLQSKSFNTEEDCQRSGGLEASLFPRHMDDWKTQSNLERHPELRSASK